MLLYAITDRRLFSSPAAMIDQAASWAEAGVDFVQIREKDLSPAEHVQLVARIVRAVRAVGTATRVLLNGPARIAAATGCAGVHLTADHQAIAIAEAREAMREATASAAVVSVSCHTLSDIERARSHGATLSLFAPVFEKQAETVIVPGHGLDVLAHACRAGSPMPVFALGGVTARNAVDCIDAGAAGIAAIRLFASGDWRTLRASS